VPLVAKDAVCMYVVRTVGDEQQHQQQTGTLSSANCSRAESVGGERIAALSLRCHGDGVVDVTSLCAGYLSSDCHGCCMDELQVGISSRLSIHLYSPYR